MSRLRKDLDVFRDEIERRIASKYIHRQIQSWLTGEGLVISRVPYSCGVWPGKRLVGRERQARILPSSTQ
jgi:hypothetical protein